MNAFRNSGIFPVNFSAVRSSKLSPSNLYSDATKCCKSSPPRSGIAPQEFEQLLRSETRRKFQSRYEEGYDVEDDEFYIVWKKMKELSLSKSTKVTEKAADSQHKDSSLDSMKQQQGHPSGKSVLDEILVYPKPKATRPKTVKSQLPNHLSGEQMIRLLT